MAEAFETQFTHAVEKIREWYHGLRVDHLSPEELDFETNIRSIVIRDDPTYSRRRRWLREHMKTEKQNDTIIEEVVLEGNGEEVVQFCRRNFDELFAGLQQSDKNSRVRGKAKLLHFGHRLILYIKHFRDSEETESFLKSMLVDVVDLLDQYFYTKTSASEQHNQEGLEEQALIDLFRSENVSAVPPLRNADPGADVSVSTTAAGISAVANQLEGSDCVRSLLARINELEAKMARMGTPREEEAQHNETELPTGSSQPLVGAPPVLQVSSAPHSSLTPFPGFSSSSQGLSSSVAANPSRPITSVTFSLPQSHPTAQPQPPSSWHSYLQNQQQPFQPPITNPWLGFPGASTVPSLNPVPGSAAMSLGHPGNPWLGNPTFTTPPVNPWAGTSVPISTSFAHPSLASLSPLPLSNPARHTLPVSKWTVTKYDGEDQGLKLNQFLGMVHAMAVAEHASEAELFDSAIHLFKGPALQWYMTMRATGRLVNWQHLVLELRRTFMHPDLDTLIKMKVYQRHQSRNETFLQFYHGMEELFGTMSVPLPEHEKVQILLQNMRIDYKKQLNFLPIADLPTLVSAGQKIDAVNFSVYNKVFGPEKTVNVVEYSEPKKCLSQDKPNKSSTPHQQTSSRNTKAHSPPQTNQNRKGSETGTDTSRGPARAPTTLEDMIKSHKPLSSRHCFNCGLFGHRMDQCRLPRGVLCENCGFRGYPTNNCPYCVKNALAASQNRRPLNPNY
ncbi:uncharacterized protein LOC134285347 [Aedes albopictus]|uniref:CCHC-type domain-containing protein n=1 Tax=Aedes albopictus TaxID=7160 RepID=A0ABM1ZPX9_AEDAL